MSHARSFLNEVCTDILHLNNKEIIRYKGDFDAFEAKKSQEAARDDRARDINEKKRDELQAFIARNIGGGAKGARMAKSRQKTLAKMATFDSVIVDPSIKVCTTGSRRRAGGFFLRPPPGVGTGGR